MSAAKAASAVALDTRTGTRVAKTTESIAYDTAWGGASSGTLKVNGTVVSGLSSKGAYSWTPNSSQTNYWKLTYTAGTANYSATFKHSGYYAITYANTKGAANSNPAQYNIDSSITFTPLANVTGYVFNGWNPASIPAGGFGAKTVTAQWTPITYSVKFNKNGGTGTMADESFTYGTAKALTANAFTRTGYTFTGWATTSGATTAAYTDKQSVSNLTATAGGASVSNLATGGTLALYAVWRPNAYTIRFLPNGAEGEMADQAATYDTATNLTANAFTKEGYWFVGWCLDEVGAVSFTNRQEVLNLTANDGAVVTLVAKWADAWYVNAATGDDANEGFKAEQPLKTIQRAIDLAEDGQLIVVADGVYAPIVSDDKSITIRSVNGAGVSGEASRSDEGYLRLPAPENVTATNGGFVDRVDVAWESVTAANYYRVFRSTSASGSKTPISEWQTELSYSDATAEPGVTYYYFVAAALDDQGLSMSGYSAGAEGSLKIGAPTGVYATDGTSATGVTVSWNTTPGAEGYKVYRGTSNNPDAAEVVSSVSSVSFDDTTAEPGTLYFYWIVATNTVSESAKSAVETGFRSIPAPTGITATTMSGAAAVTVSWTPVEGALFYRVYRGTRTGGDYAVEIDTTTETTYADEGGAANRTYYYSVKAVGASCESNFSAFVAGSR